MGQADRSEANRGGDFGGQSTTGRELGLSPFLWRVRDREIAQVRAASIGSLPGRSLRKLRVAETDEWQTLDLGRPNRA